MQTIQKDQSKVLLIASLTEFGERYSYYMLQSLLILFLVFHFKIAQNISSVLVGTVLSMIYISAIVGGFIADKILGYYRSAFLGSLMMIVGSLLLSASKTIDVLYLGLCFIAISTGLIKSNISSFIGRYYDRSGLPHSYRDFGFNVFYVGINLGSFLAYLLASFLANKYGYNVAFYSSIGINALMIINLIIGYFVLSRYITDMKLSFKMIAQALSLVIIYMVLVFIILKNPTIANISIFVAAALCILVLIRAAMKSGNYKRAATAVVFFILSIIYWALYFQQYISIELFIKSIVKHHFLGINIATTQIMSSQPLAVLIFGFFMGRLWIYLDKRGKAMHDIDKFNIGFILTLVLFIFLYIAITMTTANEKVAAGVFIIGFIIWAISELSLSAIGLSLMTKIAPKGFVSLYMGIWLVTLGIGGKIAGLLAAKVNITNNIVTSKASMQHGLILFMIYTVVGIVICIIGRKFIIRNLTTK